MPSYYQKEKSEDRWIETESVPQEEVIFINKLSQMHTTRTFYHGAIADAPIANSFELAVANTYFSIELPEDTVLQLLVNGRPITMKTRPCCSAKLNSKKFEAEYYGVSQGLNRLLFQLENSFEDLRQAIFLIEVVHYNRIDNGTVEKYVAGVKRVIRRVRLEPEIYGVCRFYGSQILFGRVFNMQIFSGQMNRIVGTLQLRAFELQIDRSVEAMKEFSIVPWSPDPRVKIIASRSKDCACQTYDFLDSEQCIVEIL